MPLDFAKGVSPPDQEAGAAPESMPFPNLSPRQGYVANVSIQLRVEGGCKVGFELEGGWRVGFKLEGGQNGDDDESSPPTNCSGSTLRG